MIAAISTSSVLLLFPPSCTRVGIRVIISRECRSPVASTYVSPVRTDSLNPNSPRRLALPIRGCSLLKSFICLPPLPVDFTNVGVNGGLLELINLPNPSAFVATCLTKTCNQLQATCNPLRIILAVSGERKCGN